jgi:hypothetical protein
LVIESDSFFEPISLEKLASYGFVIKESIFPPFNYLNDERQKEIRERIQKYLEFKRSEIDLAKLNVSGLFNLYQMSVYVDYMDYSILKYFFLNKKEIRGLETREKVISVQEIDDCSIKGLEELVDHYNTRNLQAKLFNFMRNELYYRNLDCHDTNVHDSKELLIRNTDWMPKIVKLDSSIIVCVGYAHLFYQNGILGALKSDGYTIKRMDTLGKFTIADDLEIYEGMKNATKMEKFEIFTLCLKNFDSQDIKNLLTLLLEDDIPLVYKDIFDYIHNKEILDLINSYRWSEQDIETVNVLGEILPDSVISVILDFLSLEV